jgi:hypothetical protein
MTNLTEAGKLEKTENMRLGSFNKMVHTWRLLYAQPIPQAKGQSTQEKRTTLF